MSVVHNHNLLDIKSKLWGGRTEIKDNTSYSISHLFTINLDICDIVLEHSGHIDLWELVLAEHDQETSLPARTVTDYHELLTDSRHFLVFSLKLEKNESTSLSTNVNKTAPVGAWNPPPRPLILCGKTSVQRSRERPQSLRSLFIFCAARCWIRQGWPTTQEISFFLAKFQLTGRQLRHQVGSLSFNGLEYSFWSCIYCCYSVVKSLKFYPNFKIKGLIKKLTWYILKINERITNSY